MLKSITAQELAEILERDPDSLELIDVREADEYKALYIKGAKLISGATLAERMDEINWIKKTVFYCRSGARSRLSANFASARTGHDAYNLEGGIEELYSISKKDFFDPDGGAEQLK